MLLSSLDAGSELLRPQRESSLQEGGCYVEKPQRSHDVLASGQGRVRSWMITVLSLKVFAPSEEPLEVCSNPEHAWSRNRIQGKSILTSRLGCYCVCTALCRIAWCLNQNSTLQDPLVSEPEPRLLSSQGPSPARC